MKIVVFSIFIHLSIFAQEKIEIIALQNSVHYDYPENSVPNIENINNYEKTVTFSRYNGADLIYSHTVNQNSYGFRIYNDLKNTDRNKHLIFAGCSFTYGQGLRDKETFAYILQEKLKNFSVYNMGLKGAGPANHIYNWRVYDFRKLIKESEGLLIYTLISDHINRSKKDWRYLSWIKNETPYYKIENEKVILAGRVDDLLAYKFLRVLKKWNLEFYWLRLVSHFNKIGIKNDIDNMVLEIKALKAEYIKQFPNGRFVVAEMYPVPMINGKNERQYLIQKLKEADIELWTENNLSSEKEFPEIIDDYQIQNDGHPNDYANDLYSKFLINQIHFKN